MFGKYASKIIVGRSKTIIRKSARYTKLAKQYKNEVWKN